MNERGPISAARPEESGLEDLLQEVGARPVPPPQMTRDIRARVHAEWQAVVMQRKRRWRFAAAASVAAAVGLFVLTALLFEGVPAASVASVARVDGEATRLSDEKGTAQALAAGDDLYVGEEIVAGVQGRVSLSLDDHLSVRLDAGSRARLASENRLVLLRGAVYVDSNSRNFATDRLVVETALGSIRHLGTQYEVRVFEGGLRVSVREGRVTLERGGVAHVGSAGDELLVSPLGGIARSQLQEDDPRWNWAILIAPRFEIENQPLSAFLAWVARETGRTVEFASPAALDAAQRTMLRGSIADLDPRAALAAVLATTELRETGGDARRIEISME